MKNKLIIQLVAAFCLMLTISVTVSAQMKIKGEVSQSEKAARVFTEFSGRQVDVDELQAALDQLLEQVRVSALRQTVA